MLCKSIRCTDFDNEEIIINIILEGLNCNIKAYSATIAELKATLRRSPSSLSIAGLEEIFFTIDDSLARKCHEYKE
jgi:hypothetical protein